MKLLSYLQHKVFVALITLSMSVSFPARVTAQTELQNPLAADNLQDFLADVVDALVILSIPVIVFFIIYAGFTFVTSGGDTSKIETAKKTALYTVIGAAVILGASLIADILEGTYDSIND